LLGLLQYVLYADTDIQLEVRPAVFRCHLVPCKVGVLYAGDAQLGAKGACLQGFIAFSACLRLASNLLVQLLQLNFRHILFCACSACCLCQQAVKLLAQLALRLPNLVQLLQPNPVQTCAAPALPVLLHPNRPLNCWRSLRRVFQTWCSCCSPTLIQLVLLLSCLFFFVPTGCQIAGAACVSPAKPGAAATAQLDDSGALLLHQGCAQSLELALGLSHILHCTCSACPSVSQQAVKLLAQMASRLPNLVQLLQPNFDDSEALLLRQGCAHSLELALLR
jgi:hypothetical protein